MGARTIIAYRETGGRCAHGGIALVAVALAFGFAGGDAQADFHETFERAEPVGAFEPSREIRLTNTDEKGWVVETGPNLGADTGLLDGEHGRALVYDAKGGDNPQKLEARCPIAEPVVVRDGVPVKVDIVYTPLAVNAGGPAPTNKQMLFNVWNRKSSFGFQVVFDVQAHPGSPDNRFLQIRVRSPEGMPTVDDFTRGDSAQWVGPRMSQELVGRTLRVSVEFTRQDAGKATQVSWALTDAASGEGVASGQYRVGHALPEGEVLDQIRLSASRWAESRFEEILVSSE